MPMGQALRLCPSLHIVPPHFSAYQERSRQVMARIRALGGAVEQISIDEAFFDLSADPFPVETARSLQAAIRADLGLPCSIGIASNKLVAKIANEVGKSSAVAGRYPNALTVVPAGEEAAFLAPLPVEMLWGVGPKTAERLATLGITTIGGLAARDEVDMLRRFGQTGYDLTLRARGIDNRPLVTQREARSISQERTFRRDRDEAGALRQVLREEAAQVTERLRKHGLTARTVKIKVRWPDFTTVTRQTTLPAPTDEVGVITRAVEKLFDALWEPGKAVRLLGVGVSGLGKPPRQMGLWERDWNKVGRLQEAVAALRARFGEKIIWQGEKPAGE
jgi:DNA polymerase-4